MACDQEILILISAFADGETTPEESTQAKSHLDTCPDCRRMVKDWQEERQLLEWAYTLELPQEITIPTEGSRVGAETRRTRRGFTFNWRWNWAKAGAVAAVILVAFAIYRIVTLPPMLGNALTTASQSQRVRMPGGIMLEVGPCSEIVKVNDHSVRLIRGGVTASVHHGTGFEVLSKRIRVMDQGTEFTVGTRTDMDIVAVEEGSVDVYQRKATYRVNTGHVMFCRDGAATSTVSFPAAVANSGEEGRDTPIGKRESFYGPTTGDILNWNEGLLALAKRFPDAAQASGGSHGTGGIDGKVYHLACGSAGGSKSGLRKHFMGIARYLAGGTPDGSWEIPAAFIQVDGITSPVNLPADMYYVRLVSDGRKIVFRLSGAKGADADIPMEMGETSPNCSSGASYAPSGSLGWEYEYRKGRDTRVSIRMIDWPAAIKPSLTYAIRGVTPAQRNPDKAAMLSDVTRQVAQVQGLKLDGNASDLLYLDAKRQHRIFVIWNTQAKDQLADVWSKVKRGQSGPALMGVVATDIGWESPRKPAGVRLLWWVWSGESDDPSWVVTDIDLGNSVVLSETPFGMPHPDKSMDNSGNTWESGNIPGLGDVRVCFSDTGAADDQPAFNFRFWITTKNPKYPVLGEGWIAVKKP